MVTQESKGIDTQYQEYVPAYAEVIEFTMQELVCISSIEPGFDPYNNGGEF